MIESQIKKNKKKKIAKILSVGVAILSGVGVSTGFITPEFIVNIFGG